MLNPIELLDKLYASELGCVPEDFNSRKLITVTCERISEIRFAKGIPLALFSISKGDSAVVSAKPQLRHTVDKILCDRTSLDDSACDALEDALSPLIDVNFWFRGCRLYCSPDTFINRASGEVLDVTDQDGLAANLHSKWGGRVFGQIVDGKVVAWAAVKPLSDIGWDLSIQTLPEHRGKGYAKSVVSLAVCYIFENGKLATWGTDRTNIASLNTAHSVGFQDYGLDFGCVEQTNLENIA